MSADADAYETALETMEQALLLPRDAFHWAIMQACEITAIATTDTDFLRIPALTIHTCNEKMLRQRQR